MLVATCSSYLDYQFFRQGPGPSPRLARIGKYKLGVAIEGLEETSFNKARAAFEVRFEEVTRRQNGNRSCNKNRLTHFGGSWVKSATLH